MIVQEEREIIFLQIKLVCESSSGQNNVSPTFSFWEKLASSPIKKQFVSF